MDPLLVIYLVAKNIHKGEMQENCVSFEKHDKTLNFNIISYSILFAMCKSITAFATNHNYTT